MQASRQGYTVIEVLVVIMIIGIMAVIMTPNVINSMEVRELENAAKDIMTVMQRAKYYAVRDKLNTRVHFENTSEGWEVTIEREDTPGTWAAIPQFIKRMVSTKFLYDIDFPGDTSNQYVEFSPLGFISNYSSDDNRIAFRSEKLYRKNQPPLREVHIFPGGSVKYYVPEA